MEFEQRTALITGASSGIGAGFAAALAARSADLVLVARRTDRLEALAAELRAGHGVQVTVIGADLSRPGAGCGIAEQLATAGIEVDVLVNNAGFGLHGEFAGQDPARVEEQIAVDVTAVVSLTRTFLPAMIRRGHGAVVNVASTGAFQPVPYMAVYGACKAFVLSFTEALWAELRGCGVHALALCPGPTSTEFFQVAAGTPAVGQRQTADQVVVTALRALDRSAPPPSVVSGAGNAIAARLARFAPRRATIRVTGRLMDRRGHR